MPYTKTVVHLFDGVDIVVVRPSGVIDIRLIEGNTTLSGRMTPQELSEIVYSVFDAATKNPSITSTSNAEKAARSVCFALNNFTDVMNPAKTLKQAQSPSDCIFNDRTPGEVF